MLSLDSCFSFLLFESSSASNRRSNIHRSCSKLCDLDKCQRLKENALRKRVANAISSFTSIGQHLGQQNTIRHKLQSQWQRKHHLPESINLHPLLCYNHPQSLSISVCRQQAITYPPRHQVKNIHMMRLADVPISHSATNHTSPFILASSNCHHFSS